MEYFFSAAEVAKLVGVHYRTIENWAAQEYLERNEERKYGLLSAFKYRIDQLERELEKIKEDPNSALKNQKLAAEVDKERAIARIKRLEADKLEGTLVDANQVLTTWKNAIAKTKAKFVGIPVKLSLELSGLNSPKEIEIRLTEAINEALNELVE